MTKKFGIFLIFLISFFQLKGQDSTIYDLKLCLDFALQNSYLIKSDVIDSQERNARYLNSRSEYLPQIDAYVDYYYYLNDFPTYIFPENEGNILSGGTSTGPYPVPLGLSNNLNAGLSINQVVFDKNFLLASSFKENIEKIDMLKAQLTRETIIYDVSLNFYNLSSLLAKKELLEFNLERLNKIEKLLEIHIQNGFARNIDKGKLDLERAKVLSGRDQMDAGISRLASYLKFLMGMPVEKDFSINNEDLIIDTGISFTEPTEDLSNTQSELLNTQIEISELEMDKVKADYFLTLNAYAHFRAQAQREAFNFFQADQDWYLINLLGIRLDIPILRGGAKKKQIETQNINASKIKLNQIKLQENLKMEYENARHLLINSVKNIEYIEHSVETSKNIHDKTSALFEEGLVPLSDLLEAESTYQESAINLITAEYGFKIAELKYLKATGNLFTYSEEL